MNNYLMHHGVKGMKWGVRKASKAKRVGNKITRTVTEEANTKPVVGAKISNELYKSSNIAANQIRSSGKTTRKVSVSNRDVRTMSDQELQQVVNRMNLERQYNSLTTYEVETGYGHAANVLNNFGTVLALTGSAVTIYATMKGLK